MNRTIRRRWFVNGVLAASAAAWAGMAIGCGGEASTGTGGGGGAGGGGPKPGAKSTRRSAKAMSSAEIDRFQRAFTYAVSTGLFDVFNDEHFDHMRNKNHGADVQATAPITVEVMPTSWGYRLLPWPAPRRRRRWRGRP